MEKLRRQWKEWSISDRIFLLVFVCWLVLTMTYNWLYLTSTFDSDTGGEFIFMQKVYETGNPFTPEYANSSELFFSRPWMIFILFYAFGQNLIVSAKLSLLATTLLIVLSWGYFFKKLGWRLKEIIAGETILLAITCIFEGYSLYQYNNSYSIFFCAAGVSLGILAGANRGEHLRPLHWLVFGLIALYLGMCGIRMLLLLYIPIFLSEFLFWVRDKVKKKTSEYIYNIYIYIYICGIRLPMLLSLVGLVANICGMALNQTVLAPLGAQHVKFDVNTHALDTAGKAFAPSLKNLLIALGLNFTDAKIFSLGSLIPFYFLALIVVLLIGFFGLKILKSLSEVEKKSVSCLALSVVLVFLSGVIIFNDGVTARYYLFAPEVTGILAFALYRYFQSREDLKVLHWLYFAFLLVGICLVAKFEFPKRVNDSPAMQLEAHMEEQGETRFVATYWNVSNIEFISNGKFSGVEIMNNETLSKRDWITDRSQYSNDDEPLTILLTKAEKEEWEESEKRGYLLSLADREEEFAGYFLYSYEESPLGFDLFSYGENARFKFYSLAYDDAASLDHGEIALGNGGVQYGPYCALPAGVYDVTVRGGNLTEGIFDAMGSGQGLELEDLQVTPEEVRYTVRAEMDLTNVEFRCWNYTDAPMIIRDITVTPRDVKPIWE